MLQILKDEPLSKHTTLKIGGPAKYFAVVRSYDELKEALDFAKFKKFRVFIMGLGSNLLAPDKGFDGLVIKYEVSDIEIKGTKVFVEAGMPLQTLLYTLRDKGLGGLEFLVGIPGSVGGAVYMNAGLKDLWISKFIDKVWFMDYNGKENALSKTACKFDYRRSIFQDSRIIIKKIELNPRKDTPKSIKEKMQAYLKEKMELQPYNLPSAGSVFKNPKSHFAGKLIEMSGLKGTRIGDAEISPKHANFIVNLGHASAHDVEKLISLIKNKVWEKFRVKLHLEIEIFS